MPRANAWNRAALTGAVCGCVLLLAEHASAAAFQDLDSIRQAAEQAVRSQPGPSGMHVDAAAEDLDARLRLPACEKPLKAQVQANDAAPRPTVEVRCDAGVAWKIYVPVRRVAMRSVIVTVHPLDRGKVLAADDVILADRDTATLATGYVTDLQAVVGQTLRRAVGEGTPLSPAMLNSPAVVQRGQQITLEAGSTTFRVRMAGIAQTPGGLGQTITVKNAGSGNLVQAVVRSEKSAEVLLP